MDGGHAQDADAAVRAARTIRGPVRDRDQRWDGHGGRDGWRIEHAAAAIERRVPVMVRQQAEVPDAHKATWQDVEQKPPEEFLGGERHDFGTIVVRVVPPAKAHGAVVSIHKARVRDRDAVRVPTEIPQHLGRAAEQRQSILPIVTEKRLSSITRIIL